MSLKGLIARVADYADNSRHHANCLDGIVRELRMMEMAQKLPAPQLVDSLHTIYERAKRQAMTVPMQQDAEAVHRYVETPWGHFSPNGTYKAT